MVATPELARAAQAAERQAEDAEAGREPHRAEGREDPGGAQRLGFPRARGRVQSQAPRFPGSPGAHESGPAPRSYPDGDPRGILLEYLLIQPTQKNLPMKILQSLIQDFLNKSVAFLYY